MRKKTAILCSLFLLLGLSACARNQEGTASLSRDGIAPYELSEENKSLLQAFGLSGQNSQILVFKAPKEAVSMNFHVYCLGEDKAWERIDGGGIMRGWTDGEDGKCLEGLFTMQLKEDYAIEFHISDSGSSAAYESAPVSWPHELPAKTWTFLQEFQKIELNAEIPIAILSYTNENGLSSSRLEDNFDPEGIENPDLVQAVTLEFSDQEL